ncbi:MAG: PLP-dependent aminotransferase family protein [Chloroflexi bacterium]|nr:PLP-dependent aminotransferase family protein [Chloroflexota bacterium]
MTPMLRVTQANPDPTFINLGIGQPALNLLPLAQIQQGAQMWLAENDPSALNYGVEEGEGYLRVALAEWLSGEYGTAVSLSNLFISAGASQALDLICTLYSQPGDVVLVEEPTYFLALRIFADHGLQVVGVAMDEQGLIPEAVEAAVRQHRPAFLYTIPSFQNPTAVTLPAERRAQLVALAEQYGFLIVADEVYQLLGYTAAPPPPLASHSASGHVLGIGSFSKILAPGLRLGWVQAAPQHLQRLVGSGLVDSGGGVNPLVSAVVRGVLTSGAQQAYVAQLRAEYGRRIRVLDEALQTHLPQAQYVVPQGGFFFWLSLPEGVDTAAQLPRARALGVGYQPGRNFSSRGDLASQLRLSFAFYDEEALREAAVRLGQWYRQLAP